MARYASQRWSEDESYPQIREALAKPYRSLPGEDLEALLAAEGIEAEDLEDFLSGLKSVGRFVAPALPVIGSIAGTAIGGPVGTALGGMAGRFAGQALGGALGPEPSRGARAVGGAISGGLRQVAGGGLPGAGGSPLTGQLLGLLARPETLRALTAMLLGSAGRRSVPVGGTPVPVGAFANALGVLANQASAEYAERVPMPGEGTPAYLMDFAGEAAVDPAVPEARAARLLELLHESEPESDEAEPVEWRPAPRRLRRASSADAFYDAIEQAELAVAGEGW